MMTKNKSQQRSLFKYFSIIPIAFLLVMVLANKNEAATDQTLSSISPLTTVIAEPGNTSEASKKVLGDPDEMPRFAGCEEVKDRNEQKKCSMDKLIQFIVKQVKYPEAAKKAGIEGTVVIGFTVKEDGSLSDFEVAKSLEGSCDAEALRVFQMMPNWIPGKKDGKAVAVNLKLPIQFKLPSETDSKASVEDGKEVFKVVEEMPRFPGCEDLEDKEQQKLCAQKKMLQYIYENIKYPAEARKAGIQGTVIVQFIIEEDGSISGSEIKKTVGGGCDEEVIRVVNSMPKWTPGKQHGENVRVQFVLPVKFKLDNDADTNDNKALLKKLEKASQEYYLLVDGEEVDDISAINPDEIATVDVYKGDEEAIIKYGPKAENGVISIRLNKGQKESLYSDIPPPAPLMPQGFENFNELQLEVFKVYPNPSSGKVSIELGTIDRVTNIIVADASGKVVYIQKITDLNSPNIRLTDIDVSKAAKGNVFVIVEQGGKKITRKVILQ